MHRRTLLRRTGAIGALALAGCTGQASEDDGNGGDGGGSDGGSTPTATPNPVTMQDTTFEVTGRGGASDQQGSADVEFDTADDRLVVTGTIVGSDGCKTAALGDVKYDTEADELRVNVVTKDEEGSEDKMCTQALVDIDYELVVRFDGGIPKSASVSHNGQGVTSGAHGEASAGDDSDA